MDKLKHNLKTLWDAYCEDLFREEFDKLQKELRELKEKQKALFGLETSAFIPINEILGETE